MSYTYNIAATFPGGLELGQLQTLILEDPSITTGLVGLTSDTVDLVITFTGALSGPELAALGSVIAAYTFVTQPTTVPNGSMVQIDINNMIYRANTTAFRTIGQMAWVDDRYRRYQNPVAIVLATVYDRDLEWMLYDTVAAVSLGSSIITGSGTWVVGFVIPTGDTIIELQIRKTSLGGQDPEISSVVLEFVN